MFTIYTLKEHYGSLSSFQPGVSKPVYLAQLSLKPDHSRHWVALAHKLVYSKALHMLNFKDVLKYYCFKRDLSPSLNAGIGFKPLMSCGLMVVTLQVCGHCSSPQ